MCNSCHWPMTVLSPVTRDRKITKRSKPGTCYASETDFFPLFSVRVSIFFDICILIWRFKKKKVIVAGEITNWRIVMQLEHYKTTQINSMMQAIAAVPVFDGRTWMWKNMWNSASRVREILPADLIDQQVEKLSWDETMNKYILGYYYSLISTVVLTNIGTTFKTAWATVKQSLRENTED